jgi:hypothetical protein
MSPVRLFNLAIFSASILLSGCTANILGYGNKQARPGESISSTPALNNTPNNPATPPKNDEQPGTTTFLLAPDSTEGLLALNQYRSHNEALNDYLLHNPKPDYFFGNRRDAYTDRKVYLVYLASETLYVFDAQSSEPYKKFHPLPESIRGSLKTGIAQAPRDNAANPPGKTTTRSVVNRTVSQPAATPGHAAVEGRNTDIDHNIEKSLSIENPEPYLQISLLNSIPLEPDAAPVYADTYFLDLPLSELLDNDYSMKFDAAKKTLKLIFPKSYNVGTLYQNASIEARKLFVIRPVIHPDNSMGTELSLVVPDFLPGSALYQNTHGAMSKVFASLYQVTMPASFREDHLLRMRYSLKLCQADSIRRCAVREGNSRSVRAIVIAATLYDSNTKTVIDTFLLK